MLRELSIHPDQRFVLASYGLDLARDNSRAIRDDMIQNGSWLGVRPKRGRAAVTNWGVERYRGGVQAAGVGSALVGKPADAVVIDGVVPYPPGTLDLQHEVELVVALGRDAPPGALPVDVASALVLSPWHARQST